MGRRVPSCPPLDGVFGQVLGVVVEVLGRVLPREPHERILRGEGATAEQEQEQPPVRPCTRASRAGEPAHDGAGGVEGGGTW